MYLTKKIHLKSLIFFVPTSSLMSRCCSAPLAKVMPRLPACCSHGLTDWTRNSCQKPPVLLLMGTLPRLTRLSVLSTGFSSTCVVAVLQCNNTKISVTVDRFEEHGPDVADEGEGEEHPRDGPGE